MDQEIEFKKGAINPIECYKEAWEFVKPNFGILFASSVLAMLIGGISFYILLGAFLCGVYMMIFQAMDGRKPELDTMFKGMEVLKPSLVVTAIFVVPAFIVFGLLYLPVIGMAVAGQNMSPDELMAFISGIFVVDVFFALIMVCVHTLLMFAFPLVADKRMSGWSAIKLSARASLSNLGGLAGLWTVGFVLSLAGTLVFCIGTYLVIPIILAATAVAYRKVFPEIVVQTEDRFVG
ncbi:MAG: hypothetical protein R2684_05700 [Pyrinomonadaceae bacterium]